MGMTISQKILAGHSSQSAVNSGDIIQVSIDLVFGNEISAAMAIKELEKIGFPPLKAAKKAYLFPDHYTPTTSDETAECIKTMRDFSKRMGIDGYIEVGDVGIEHAMLPEMGLIVPGDMIIGGDSHSCTHGALGAFSTGVGSTDLAGALALGETWFKVPASIRIEYTGQLGRWVGGKDLILYTIGKIGAGGALGGSIEFCGPVINRLDLANRLTMTNMAVEAGAVNGIMEPDEAVRTYLEGRAKRPGLYLTSDADAFYEQKIRIDVSQLGPQVAQPFSPANVAPVEELAGIRLDQVFIGSCTNARLTDLRVAAGILKGRRVSPGVRLLVSPATRAVYKQALDEGLLKIFLEAGAVLFPSTCGTCFGHIGVLAAGETCLSTSNRNFKGRMGHIDSRVYLSSPAVAAASAVRGQITHPAEIIE